MGILLAFLPFFVFIVVEWSLGVTAGLVAATITSAAFLVRDVIIRKRAMKVLEFGTIILFGVLAAYTLFAQTKWSIPAVRLCVDSGFLMVVLVSIGVRQPITLQYARENAPRESWGSPRFVRTNYIITAAWAGAFALMVVTDLLILFVPSLPTFVAIVVTVLAIWGAAQFTSWYPERELVKHSRLAPRRVIALRTVHSWSEPFVSAWTSPRPLNRSRRKRNRFGRN
jgi:hypothetical protein